MAAWRESPLFDARERCALELTDAITKLPNLGVPDALYARTAEHFSGQEIANLVLAVAAINAWNRIAVSGGMIFRPDPA